MYRNKYLKYKTKYLKLKNQTGGAYINKDKDIEDERARVSAVQEILKAHSERGSLLNINNDIEDKRGSVVNTNAYKEANEKANPNAYTNANKSLVNNFNANNDSDSDDGLENTRETAFREGYQKAIANKKAHPNAYTNAFKSLVNTNNDSDSDDDGIESTIQDAFKKSDEKANKSRGSVLNTNNDSDSLVVNSSSSLPGLSRPFLARSISNPIEYDEQSVYENSALKVDSGYSFNKRLTINNKEITYTEDAHARFSFGNYDILIVADGHGGTYNISRKSVALAQLHFKEFLERASNDVSAALTTLCEFIHNETKTQMQGGSTFNMAVIDKTNNKLYSANLGDSVLLVLRKNNNSNKYELLFKTHSHDAADLSEQSRIRRLDPRHRFNMDGPSWRMQNGLMTTRGFGDIRLDSPTGIISRIPEIETIQLVPYDLIIQSSDGLYETFYSSRIKTTLAGNEEIRIPEIIAEVNKNYDIIGLPQRLLDDQALKIRTKSGYSISDINQNRDNQAIHVYKVKNSSRPQLLKSNSM